MHPLCQVMEILPVAVPFEFLVPCIPRRPLGQRFSDPETAGCRMLFGLFRREPANPAGMEITAPVAAQGVVNLINEADGEVPVHGVVVLPEKTKIITDRKCIGPEVPLRLSCGRIQAGLPCKFLHEPLCRSRCFLAVHCMSEITEQE